LQIDVEGLVLNEDTIIDLKIGQVCPHHGIQLAGYALGLYHPRLETPAGRFARGSESSHNCRKMDRSRNFIASKTSPTSMCFVSALYTTYWKMQNAKFYREINQ